MSRGLPTLWQSECASSCHAYAECDGSDRAPCGCAFLGTDRAYLCDECWLNCRERLGSEVGDVGKNHYADGLALKDLRIANRFLDLPPLIAAATRELPASALLPAVAAGVGDLFRRDPKAQIRPASRLKDRRSLKAHLRCAQDGVVLGVLNATDQILELLWNAEIATLGPQLVSAGLTGITGPTFSVLGETSTANPYHNLTMLRRHHRIVQQLFHRGLEVIPNLYWRTQGGLDQWSDVLRRSDINTVSRDFSRTRSGPQFEDHLSGLLELLAAVNRPMRVIVIGVGVRKAVRTLTRIEALGCSCTIVTSDPIRLAINRGAEIFRRRSGDLAIRKQPRRSREDLAVRNIRVLSQELQRRASEKRRKMHDLANASTSRARVA